MKILISLNTAWNLINFRAGLIRSLISAGHEVVAVAPPDTHVDRVRALGCRYVPFEMDNHGTHPGRDLLLMWRFFCLLRQEKPDIFLGYTIKPNIYGSLAAHVLGIPVINNIAGLGAVFVNDNWLTWLVKRLYRFALSRSKRVFFQNDDDKSLFVGANLVKQEVTDRLPGSGVNLSDFSAVTMPQDDFPVRFLLIARMLWDKGVGEFVEASMLLKHRFENVDFCLLGFLDKDNPAAISLEKMNEWVSRGYITYLGETNDVRPHIASATCVVLPSFYREGVPRTLLEAAAVGRPIITTNAVGCREVVEDGVNGYLCKARDARDLADKMAQFVSLTAEQRAEMGRYGREKAEKEFDEQIVINKYLNAIQEVLVIPTAEKGDQT